MIIISALLHIHLYKHNTCIKNIIIYKYILQNILYQNLFYNYTLNDREFQVVIFDIKS